MKKEIQQEYSKNKNKEIINKDGQKSKIKTRVQKEGLDELILKKFKMRFTINAITKPVEESSPEFMSVEQLKECYNYGAEIACHGHTHQNNRQDVLDNINFLKND